VQKTKYNWAELQQLYDAGYSWRDLEREFGISKRALQKGVARGALKTRTVREAHGVLRQKGWKPPPMGDDARKALSERQSLNNSGGRCKWFDVNGQRVQGTWERDAGLKLTELGIEWRKCSGRADIIKYTLDGKERSYTPDFFLPGCNVFLEFKGYWWGDDRRKMQAVFMQNHAKQIAIIELKEYNAILNLSIFNDADDFNKWD
jgi:hypothetical protein